jgi:hypothetical protein
MKGFRLGEHYELRKALSGARIRRTDWAHNLFHNKEGI